MAVTEELTAAGRRLTGFERQRLRDAVWLLARAGRLERRDRRRLLRHIPRSTTKRFAFERDLDRSDLLNRDVATGIFEASSDYERELVTELTDVLRAPILVEERSVAAAREPRSRRSRATQRARSPGSDDDPEPPRVTDRPSARPCEVCGEDFTPRRRSNARICSNRCRQMAHRRRSRQRLSVTPERPRLTFDERRILGEIVRKRKLAKLEAEDRHLNARIRAEFERDAA
jgi:hypothetical protein